MWFRYSHQFLITGAKNPSPRKRRFYGATMRPFCNVIWQCRTWYPEVFARAFGASIYNSKNKKCGKVIKIINCDFSGQQLNKKVGKMQIFLSSRLQRLKIRHLSGGFVDSQEHFFARPSARVHFSDFDPPPAPRSRYAHEFLFAKMQLLKMLSWLLLFFPLPRHLFYPRVCQTVRLRLRHDGFLVNRLSKDDTQWKAVS